MTPSELNFDFLKMIEDGEDPAKREAMFYDYVRSTHYGMHNATKEQIDAYFDKLSKTCPTCGQSRKRDEDDNNSAG